ncbi:DoxX-like protein [Azotobacter vinelandii CA]|uniref:DoxX-like protein n=2 Tax=Azotobacter vinelandii TaxID=354 RepID=C1DJY3_AZOVD|nr:DoxX family protein [Azotobacter vinelandii]ACO80888.1 DoxX-like protein [Azotobacter vinelandii DJ]AGK14242.1 DoxX-like protein [Azotobacter vinelandii CA]AGK22217.1 DoxX-like protein [Azotobacter vinelandii CA6]WKN21682.1 DoxX family protein [Azotobacter vinelandii]SFX00886.1 putative oxidoreductase [Azotobacter vinelandii]
MTFSLPTNLHNATTLTGRALLASLFLVSGLGKATAPAATLGYIGSIGLPFPALALAAALVVELGFATALLLGYRTRLVAFVMAGFSIATALMFHNQLGDQNQFIHFLKNLAIAGGLLQVAAFGPGALSLDARSGRRVAQA